MNILITGTAGFIGYHLATRMLDDGHRVFGLDCLNDYYYRGLKEARHKKLNRHEGFNEQRMDLCDRESLEKLFADNRVDLIIHLAAQAGVRYSLSNPYAYVDSNLVGFVNLLEQAKLNGISKVIYASSSSVYAGLTELPYSETQRTDKPISLYAASKKANELIAHTYSHLFGLTTMGVRFFTVYGPWGRPDMALWIFTEKIQRGQPIPVFNNGNMLRDFTFIDDVVDGLAKLAAHQPEEKYRLFNIGNNRPVELLKYIALIEEQLGKKAKMEMLPMQAGDVNATCADISAIQEAVGYAPKTTIDDGVPRFIDWYKNHPEITQAVAKLRENDRKDA